MGQVKKEPENIKRLVAEMGSDIDAFGELYRFYQPMIYRFVMTRVGNRPDAEDITAMTFEKALRNVDKYDPDRGKLSTWLYQIANNTVTDHRRKTGRVKVGIDNVEEALGPVVDRHDESVEAYITITQYLRLIPRSYQEVLVLRFIEGLGLDQIAEIVGCTRSNASTRIHRGLKALGKQIQEANP